MHSAFTSPFTFTDIFYTILNMNTIPESEMEKGSESTHEFRCMKCGKMLAKSKDISGLEIKCLRCGSLNRVLEKMIEQVIITDRNGVILFINKAVEMATGYSMEESVGKRPSQLWGGNMSKEFYVDMWGNMIRDKKSTKIKMTNKKKTGELYDVELLISPIADTNENIIFFVGIEVIT